MSASWAWRAEVGQAFFFSEGSQLSRLDGYTTDVNFPAFFYKEMQPLWLSQVANWQGVDAPDVQEHFAMCELGCGIGMNLLVAAACHPQAEFVGVDMNERHLQLAQDGAAAAGLTNIRFVQSEFTQFAKKECNKGASFDFITTHGVWSWIAPHQRQALLECVRQTLKPQGLYYLHYMCYPGATDLQTVQHFLNLFAPHVPGVSTQQVHTGLRLLAQLADRGLFHEQPAVERHLRNLLHKDVNHLAHEFLTDHWQPQYAVDLHRQIGNLGWHYLGSADVFNNLDVSLSVPQNMQAVVAQTKIVEIVEELKDMARNSHQRMDLFQKEPQALDVQAYQARLAEREFALLPHAPSAGAITFNTPIGEIVGAENICSPVLQRLAKGHASFAQLEQLPVFSGQPGLLLQTLQLFMMQGVVHPTYNVSQTALQKIEDLQQWLDQHDVAMSVVPECATAILKSA